MKKLLLIFALLLLPLSVEAKPSEEGETEKDKVCFCHNINHNPHTICTANEALINAHMDHVNGEVPGVQDSLGVCEGDEEGDDDGEDDGDDDSDDDGDGDDDGENDDTDTPSDTETPSGQGPGLLDEGQVSDGAGNGIGNFFEGSGCTLNSKVTGKQGMNWIWASLFALPLLLSRAREKSGTTS